MKANTEQNAREYILVKFEPGNILMVDKYTKKPYNYFELQNPKPILQQLKHPSLLRPVIYGTGLLYSKSESTLLVQLENRIRAHKKQYFSEEELINTFLPLLECLSYLHENGAVHGEVHPNNIVLLDGEVKMKDWLVTTHQNSYYFKKEAKNITSEDDLLALGHLMMQYATLSKSIITQKDRQLDQAIESLVENYSKNFVFALLILVKQRTDLYKDILTLLSKDQTHPALTCIDLNSVYTKAKLEKSKKLIKTPKVDKNINTPITIKKGQALSQISPSKKFNIKKSSKIDDSENKKVFNQEIKKRQIDKITKIIQRSNAFVNELMARKNNSQHNGQVLKKISGKNNMNVTTTNMSMYTVDLNKKMKQTGIAFSPSKRLRTISRKK